MEHYFKDWQSLFYLWFSNWVLKLSCLMVRFVIFTLQMTIAAITKHWLALKNFQITINYLQLLIINENCTSLLLYESWEDSIHWILIRLRVYNAFFGDILLKKN